MTHGNRAVVDFRFLSGDNLGDHLPFVFGFVGEHRAAHDIAEREHIATPRHAALRVDLDAAARVEGDSDSLQIKPVAIGAATDRDHKFVERRFLAFAVGFPFDFDFARFRARGFDDLRAHANVEFLLAGENLERLGGDFGIGRRQKIGQRFENHDFTAETLPKRCRVPAR